MTSKKVRVGVVGVGNCASALIQGVEYYRQFPDAPGLMTREIGGRLASDVEFSAAFDVNEKKVGLDLSEAIYAPPNNTRQPTPVPIPLLDVEVVRGSLLDGLGKSHATAVTVDERDSAVDVTRHLVGTRTDVLVNYLPVGSQAATEFYAAAAIRAGVAFVNAIPVFIARDPIWRGRFEGAGLPLLGDDIKSQVGATILHRFLAQMIADRGGHLARTYQLNVGGNTDFLNMKDEDRLGTKRISKTEAVVSVSNRGAGLAAGDVHIGPSDYVPWLEDQKVALIRIEGEAFAGAPFTMDVRLQVWDSPNSAGVVIDAVRYAKQALEAGVAGALEVESAWLFKAPPVQMNDEEVFALLTERNGG